MPNDKIQDHRNVSSIKVNVWDLPTRIFHWSLVILVCTSFVTAALGGNAMAYHVRCGETILVLLLFRLIWGVFGSRTSLFSSFVRGPASVWRYARGLLRPHASRHLGHNPMGGWSVMAMLLSLLIQVGTGLFATDAIATQGPLYPWVSDQTSEWLTGIHVVNQAVLAALVLLHLAAILFYLLVKKDNLILPMITGRTSWPETVDVQSNFMRPAWLAILVATVCAVVVYFLVR